MQQRPGLLAFPPQAPRQAHAPYAQQQLYAKAPYGQQQQAQLPYSQKQYYAPQQTLSHPTWAGRVRACTTCTHECTHKNFFTALEEGLVHAHNIRMLQLLLGFHLLCYVCERE